MLNVSRMNFKNWFASLRPPVTPKLLHEGGCVKTKGMEARTCPRCHEPVTYPPPGGTGSCPHCDCMLIGDPSPVEKEMLADEMAMEARLGSGPLPRCSARGIADMQARIAELTQRKKNLLDRLQNGAAADDPGWQSLLELNLHLNEARGRLTEYQLQQEGLN